MAYWSGFDPWPALLCWVLGQEAYWRTMFFLEGGAGGREGTNMGFRLKSHPSGVAILQTTSCHRNQENCTHDIELFWPPQVPVLPFVSFAAMSLIKEAILPRQISFLDR